MRPTPTWVERLARMGIVAKAIVYLAIGTLATGVALHRWAFRLGRYGLATRGLVLGAIGYLVFRAAAALDPDEAGGVGDVLARI